MCLLHSTVYKAGTGAESVLAYSKVLRAFYKPGVRFYWFWGGNENVLAT